MARCSIPLRLKSGYFTHTRRLQSGWECPSTRWRSSKVLEEAKGCPESKPCRTRAWSCLPEASARASHGRSHSSTQAHSYRPIYRQAVECAATSPVVSSYSMQKPRTDIGIRPKFLDRPQHPLVAYPRLAYH